MISISKSETASINQKSTLIIDLIVYEKKKGIIRRYIGTQTFCAREEDQQDKIRDKIKKTKNLV